jgi:dsDNA-binding SOS-regulon protein
MAVVAKWMCDRDNTMFDSKKEADAYDKMLELAEQFTALLQAKVTGVDEEQAEEFGIFLARNKDQVAKACKGDCAALAGILNPAVEDSAVDDNVMPLTAQS